MADFLIRPALTRSLLMGSLIATGMFTVSACTTPVSNETASEAPAQTSPVTETTSDTEPSATETPAAESSIVATGQFTGASDHVVTGGVEVVEVDGEYFIQLGDDFSLDNAPDPKVGLGLDGYDPATKAGELTDFTGASTYQVPAGVNVRDYNEVYIWCEKFDVPLGVASLVISQ